MPGAVGNPVRFAFPFRRITEVGWPSTYYAFQISIVNANYDAAGTPCSPTTGPENTDHPVFMTSATMEISVVNAHRYAKTTETWTSVSGETFDGEPTTPFTDSFGIATASITYAPEPHRLTLDGGTDIPDIPVPFHPGELFKDSVNLGYEVIGKELDPSAGVCLLNIFLGGFLFYPATSGPTNVTSAASIGLADIVLTHNGRDYTPIGVWLEPNTKGSGPNAIDAPVEGWVLCQRVEVTA